MLPLFKQIINDNITPNGLYFLLGVTSGDGVPGINYAAEKRILELAGYIEENKVTAKGHELMDKYKKLYGEQVKTKDKKKKSFSTKEEEMIHQYREIFPKGMLPSGYPARLAYKELEKRFLWFFEHYDYSWDVILKATKKYVEKYRQENFNYMKTSGYFIVKSDKGITVSLLATYCDMVVDEGDNYQEPSESDGYTSAI